MSRNKRIRRRICKCWWLGVTKEYAGFADKISCVCVTDGIGFYRQPGTAGSLYAYRSAQRFRFDMLSSCGALTSFIERNFSHSLMTSNEFAKVLLECFSKVPKIYGGDLLLLRAIASGIMTTFMRSERDFLLPTTERSGTRDRFEAQNLRERNSRRCRGLNLSVQIEVQSPRRNNVAIERM